ncbi:MAG: hypothetical protein ACF8GE_07485 [Phycisphaerales bacterium JB043]
MSRRHRIVHLVMWAAMLPLTIAILLLALEARPDSEDSSGTSRNDNTREVSP